MKTYLALSLSGLFGVCMFLFSFVVPINAQEREGATEIFEIVVTAPRVTVQETRRPLRGGARVAMSYAVRYADLDLTASADRSELEDRVREAAEEICELLAERYGGGRYSAASCQREALRGAMEQVREAVAAAND